MADKLTPRDLVTLEREARAAAAKGTGRDRLIPDGGQPNLYVVVRAGGKIGFQLRYRAGKGRGAPIKVLALGAFPTLSLADARRMARSALGKVAGGADPAAERDDGRHRPVAAAPAVVANTGDVTLAAFVETYFEGRGLKLKESTRYEWHRLCKKELVPYFGNTPLAAIDYAAVSTMHLAYDEIQRTGNQLLTVLTALYKEASSLGIVPRDTNPARGVERYPNNTRERAVSPHEYRRLGLSLSRAVRGTTRDGESMQLASATIAAITMVALSGWRRGEVMGLRWDTVDLRERVARQIPTKVGPQDRVLSKPVVHLLAQQPRVVGNPFVFPGANEGTSLTRGDSAWHALRHDARLLSFTKADGSKFDGVTMHDLRHGFVTEAGNLGHDSWAAYQVVGNAGKKLRYAHLDRALYEIADDTAVHIARYLEGRRVELGKPRLERTLEVDYFVRDSRVSVSTLELKPNGHW